MVPIRHLLGLLLISFISLDASCEKHDLTVSSIPVSCYGKSDGTITINLINSSIDNFEIIIIDSLAKQVAAINQSMQFPYQCLELHAGEYLVQLSIHGLITEYPVKIESPEELKANKINIEEISGNPTNAIATVKANPSGGTPPYAVEWSENTNSQNGIIAKNLPLGVYRCTIDDNNGCGPVSATVFLFETEIEKFLSNREN